MCRPGLTESAGISTNNDYTKSSLMKVNTFNIYENLKDYNIKEPPTKMPLYFYTVFTCDVTVSVSLLDIYRKPDL